MTQEKRQFTTTPIGGPFGISMALNTLQDVIDYEEGRIQPTHGYPRFVPHPEVSRREALARRMSTLPFAVAFPSKQQACFIINDFVLRYRPGFNTFALSDSAFALLNELHPGRRNAFGARPSQMLHLVEVDGVQVVCLEDERDYERIKMLRRVWGTAFDVHGLAGESPSVPSPEGGPSLERAIGAWEGPRARGTVCFQSGMAAISTMALLAMHAGRRFVLIGPAYVDTGIIGSTWEDEVSGFECEWLPQHPTAAVLETTFGKGPTLLLTELPTNPQLLVPNVARIMDAAADFDVITAVDATVATPYNFKGLDHGFDLVMHSTSKFLGGHYDHLGGVVTSRSDELADKLAAICAAVDLGLCANQRAVLAHHLRGFSDRMARINRRAAQVADALEEHPAIDRVHYPGRPSDDQAALAEALLSPGRSGLLSFTLKEKGLEPLRRFYDAIRPPLLKGPGLGGEQSLICPYVMLAHYHDSRKTLEAKGLDFHGLRLSVGTESLDDILSGLGAWS